MIRTLIVDDDFMVAEIHREFTRRVPGFVVVGIAHSAAEALEAIEEAHPDLVVLDVYLPDRSGLEVLEEVRRTHAGTDVIMVTAAKEMASVQQAMRGGVVHYIVKPFDFARFARTLDAYRRLRRMRAAAGPVDQGDVDQLFALIGEPSEAPLPKGLNRPTLHLIVRHLAEGREPESALQVAEAIGVSRGTARRYLEYLERRGHVRLTPRYGSAGRPENRYQVVNPLASAG